MGRYQGGTELLDETTSREEARMLVNEYKLAFGDSWHVWFE